MTSYEIPHMNYDNSEEYFVHHRPLGRKIQGQYLNVSWSDIALQNVPLETTIRTQNENELYECLRSFQSPDPEHSKKQTWVGQKTSVTNITESDSYKTPSARIVKGEKPKHVKQQSQKYESERPIPARKTKKYPTKPKIHAKMQRSKYGKHMYEEKVTL